MKRKLMLGFVFFLFLGVLMGCQKPLAAKEAAEVFVNGTVYHQETEQLQQHFSRGTKNAAEEAKAHFISGLKASLALDDTYDQRLAAIFTKLEKRIAKRTSYSAKVRQEGQGKATVDLRINGLAGIDGEQLNSSIEEEVEAAASLLSTETTEEEVAQIINDISLTVYERALDEQREAEETTKVTLELMVDSADGSKWVVQNQRSLVQELLAAFGQ